jgi:zinc D-Ala-D-Ala carboxypeptidase
VAHQARSRLTAICAATVLAGCSVPAPPGTSVRPSVNSTAPMTSATPAVSITASASPSSSPAPIPEPTDSRKGRALDRPFAVDGLIVVSAEHPVGVAYRPKVGGADRLVAEAAASFAKLKRAASKNGLRLLVVSGYRSYASQRALYARYLKLYGRAYTTRYVAVAGTSEHQTGLAVDLRSPSGRGSTFDRTREWRWLRARADRFGFVQRYPKGRTKITGIGYEPWHWRYVGVGHAKAIRSLGANATLEEYLRLD